jgi:ABC-type lipoprotein release transport system permease subunit
VTVIGVVGDMHHSSLETAPRFQAYVPLLQSESASAELVVRTVGDPLTAVPVVRKAVLDVLPDVPLRTVRTMHQVMAHQTAQRRLNMLLLSLFGLLGLVISAVGLYGVLAYLVVQRTREIGVRMALGSSRTRVVLMVLTRASVLVAVGLVIGGLGAWYLSAMAEAFLFRMEPSDPRAYAAALSSLLIAATVASIVPARRAASVDPLTALRHE